MLRIFSNHILENSYIKLNGWMLYETNSIKQSSRKKRINLGTIHIQRVTPTSPINTSWGSFLMLGELTLYYLSYSMKS